MTPAIAPDVNPLGRYTGKDVCILLNIHPNTLRNYVLAGYITPLPKKVGVKAVRYLGREISRCWKLTT
jgi:predicted site-specific integrase-resolvase